MATALTPFLFLESNLFALYVQTVLEIVLDSELPEAEHLVEELANGEI
jgi:hypothetical protein